MQRKFDLRKTRTIKSPPVAGKIPKSLVRKAVKSVSKEEKIAVATERQDQIKLIVWMHKMGLRPNASANGGSRHPLEALNLKRMGVSPGYPDIELPLPSGAYHGLYIELKRVTGGPVSENQQGWLDYLNEKGYYAKVACGLEEAKAIVIHYLSLTPKSV